MAVYGKIESFDFEMNWDEYVERVEQYFIANGVEDADKQRPILLTVMNDALRDRFVSGLSSIPTQRKLLTEATLTMTKAREIAVSMEMAENEARKLKGDRVDKAENVHKFQASKECFRCGKSNHSADRCFYKNSKCHTCKEVGHLHKRCPKSKTSRDKPGNSKNQGTGGTRCNTDSARPTKGDSKKHKKSSKIHFIEDSDQEDVSEVWPIFSIKSTGQKEIRISVDIEKIAQTMELDTGSPVSLISDKDFRAKFQGKFNLQNSSTMLKTYTGEVLPVLGEANVKVSYEGQTKLLPLLVVEGDGPALFGRNWLGQLRLNWKTINMMSINEQKYSVFEDKLGTVKGITASIKLKDNAQPKFFKARTVPYALKEQIGAELLSLENAGIVEKVDSSEWATPIVPVMKPDGSVRICGDFKITINPVLEVPEYPLPTSEELFTKLNGGQKFSKLDLTQAYNQVLLDEESRKYVTINTHLGLYRYTRLPFGVAYAPAIFQRTMETVLQGLDGVGCILDDVLVTGKDDVTHQQNLDASLKRLDDYGVKLKKTKCFFMKEEVEYFAFVVNKEGIHPSPQKIEAILQLKDPQNKKELQAWLGIVNYYRKFIPDMSTIVQPLTKLLADKIEWNWTVDCHSACVKIKELLVSSEVLIHYDPEKPVTLAVDASSHGLGAVISHTIGNDDRPIAYASRTLTSAEKNYSQIEKEALAIIYGVRKFHQYLYGRKFTLLTDHKPLTLILGPKKGIPVLATSRLQRWSIQLSSYQFDIKYRSTTQNGNAGTLSRFPIDSEDCTELDQEAAKVNKIQLNKLPITAAQIAMATKNDPVLSRVMYFVTNGWSHEKPENELLPFYHVQEEMTVEEGCLLRGIRVIVPDRYRDDILNELHVNHPGMVRMKALARLFVWWPNLDMDIETRVAKCESCRKQLPNMPQSRSNPWLWPNKPWERVHIDYAGPFLNNMFLVVVDAHSKWLDVVRMSSTSAGSTINALRYMFSSYGLPKEVVSDNGPQFVAAEFESFLKKNGIKHTKSAPYHPSSNGEAERAVRTCKTGMKNLEDEERTLNQKLTSFLLSYRTTPHTLTKVTPAELFMGRKLRTRLDIIRPNLKQSVQLRNQQHVKKDRTMEVGDLVMVHDYRGQKRKPSWVRGLILQKLGPVTYTVQVGELQWKRHIDQMRACHPDCVVDDYQNKSHLQDIIDLPSYFPREEITRAPMVPSSESITPSMISSPTLKRSITNESRETMPKTVESIPSCDKSGSMATESRFPRRERSKPNRLIETM
ncbi:uncharacterized protein K02A2.6-like [Ylistrum balloti]|uniref:uncharacterized protein K02A2.6-like n=1 Tax=Ylistrum balloti TaxID=509963 RepID=UPI002905AA55|nr:uncharacterized protein K02A2.6-like [Ylistrum balloti]